MLSCDTTSGWEREMSKKHKRKIRQLKSQAKELLRDYINHNVFAQSNQGYFREVLLDNVDDAINKLSKSTPLLKSFIEKLKNPNSITTLLRGTGHSDSEGGRTVYATNSNTEFSVISMYPDSVGDEDILLAGIIHEIFHSVGTQQISENTYKQIPESNAIKKHLNDYGYPKNMHRKEFIPNMVSELILTRKVKAADLKIAGDALKDLFKGYSATEPVAQKNLEISIQKLFTGTLTENDVKGYSRDALGLLLYNAINLNGYDHTARMLLKQGADTEFRSIDGETILYQAVESGNNELVDALLSSKANVNSVTNHGITPLLAAVYYKRSDIAKKLIEEGANVLLMDSARYNAFHQAVENGCTKIVDSFLDHHPHIVDIPNGNGHTALQITARKYSLTANDKEKQTYYKIVEKLITKGANTDMSSIDRYMPSSFKYSKLNKLLTNDQEISKLREPGQACDNGDIFPYDTMPDPIEDSFANSASRNHLPFGYRSQHNVVNNENMLDPSYQSSNRDTKSYAPMAVLGAFTGAYLYNKFMHRNQDENKGRH